VVGFLKNSYVEERTSLDDLTVNVLSQYKNPIHLSVTCLNAKYIKVETKQQTCSAQKGQMDREHSRDMAGSVGGRVK
jgi:uncharacterized protein (DUF305 family)